MLRRVKEDVEKKLPPKLETTINCPLSDMQVDCGDAHIPNIPRKHAMMSAYRMQ